MNNFVYEWFFEHFRFYYKFQSKFYTFTFIFDMPPKEKNNPEKIVVKLLQEKNRPYSSITLGDELHNEIKQTQLKKILDQLSNDGIISCKVSGKAKLYFAKQDDLRVASPEELDKLDENIIQLRETADDLRTRVAELVAKRDKLLRTKPIEELRKYRVEIEDNVQKEIDEKDRKIKLSEGISPEDAERNVKDFNIRCAQWRERRNKCREIVDQLSEGMGKKPSEIYQELELETDESVGLKLEYKNKVYTVIEDIVI